MRAFSSVGRALALQARCRRFKSVNAHHFPCFTFLWFFLISDPGSLFTLFFFLLHLPLVYTSSLHYSITSSLLALPSNGKTMSLYYLVTPSTRYHFSSCFTFLWFFLISDPGSPFTLFFFLLHLPLVFTSSLHYSITSSLLALPSN